MLFTFAVLKCYKEKKIAKSTVINKILVQIDRVKVSEKRILGFH